jgi:hypothetical protein
MQCYTPGHRTICDFRKNHLKEIASISKDAEIIDSQDDDRCKIDPGQEVSQRKLFQTIPT